VDLWSCVTAAMRWLISVTSSTTTTTTVGSKGPDTYTVNHGPRRSTSSSRTSIISTSLEDHVSVANLGFPGGDEISLPSLNIPPPLLASFSPLTSSSLGFGVINPDTIF